MEKSIPLKEIVGFLPYNLQCQYEGIINGSEIAKDRKEFEKENEPFANWKDYEEIEPIYGLKIGYLKELRNTKKYWKAYIGIKYNGLKGFFNGYGFKPIVRPMSDLTNEINHNGKTFIPLVKHVESMGEPCEDFDPFFLTDYETAVLNIMSCSEIRTQYDLEFLLEHKFDVYGWIKDGLAIDLNTL